jgi:signal transduction histidine kinase
MAGSHVDLTGLKKAEDRLRQTNESLHRSQAKLQSTLSDLSASHDKLQKMQLELIQIAKLESVGTLAAGVAHEVKNPLQIIIMGLDYLESQFPDRGEATNCTLQDMRDAALRADGITKELLQFSKTTEFNRKPAQLNDLLQRSLWLIRAELKMSGTQVSRHQADDLPPVCIDCQKIQQVLINLMINSIQAIHPSGEIALATKAGICSELFEPDFIHTIRFKPDEAVVTLTIRDDGPGIAECDLPRIFDPFFTTKGTGGGNGLGLSVVREIIDLHDASIHFRNLPGRGLEVLLIFPCIPQTAVMESTITQKKPVTN